MNNPQFISILNRKLKPAFTYSDFYQAWLPSVSNSKNPQKKALGYYKMPVKVINAVNVNDPTDIISIGIIWGTNEIINQDIQRTKESDSLRGDQISLVADKGQEPKFYMVKDVNLLGT